MTRLSLVARRRLASYVVVAMACLFGSLAFRQSGWSAGAQFHTRIEIVASVLAFFVGIIGLIRFYSLKETGFLFIGAGFIVTGLFDGFHAVATASEMVGRLPSSPDSLMAWSWFVSRLYLGAILCLAWASWAREQRTGAPLREVLVFGTGAGLAVLCLGYFVFGNAPSAYLQVGGISRPQELIPAALFAFALVAYLRRGGWMQSYFDYWLVMALLLNLAAQLLFVSMSQTLSDAMFEMAPILKTASYGCVLVGLLINMKRLFDESATVQELKRKNAILQTLQRVSPDAMLVLDEEARVVLANERFLQLTGSRAQQVVNEDGRKLLHALIELETDPTASLEALRQLDEPDDSVRSREVHLDDGRVFDLYSAPMTSVGGDSYGRVWFFRDVSAPKAMQAQLVELAIRDPLTGLFNRRYLDEMLEREFARAQRTGNPLSVVMADLDHFKEVNDQHGHQTGDDVLQEFARLLTSLSRKSDIVCRYGGEEVLCLLPGLAYDDALEWVERVRAAMAHSRVPAGDGAVTVTASFGIACYPRHAGDAEALVAAADHAMYAAKQAGRNRAVGAHTLA